MASTHIFIYGECFKCRDFYDVDTNLNGIDVSKLLSDNPYNTNAKWSYVGQIWNLSIPYYDEDGLNYKDFNKKIEDWLKENFW